MPSNVSTLHLKQTFPPIIWIFNEGEGDGIESRLPFKIFSTLNLWQAFQQQPRASSPEDYFILTDPMIPDYETNQDLDPIQDDVPINERTPRGLALRSSSDNEEPVELQGTVYILGQ